MQVARSLQMFMDEWEHAEDSLSDKDIRGLDNLQAKDLGPFLYWLLNHATEAQRRRFANLVGEMNHEDVRLMRSHLSQGRAVSQDGWRAWEDGGLGKQGAGEEAAVELAQGLPNPDSNGRGSADPSPQTTEAQRAERRTVDGKAPPKTTLRSMSDGGAATWQVNTFDAKPEASDLN